jgi:hypothetical protein
MTAKQAAMQRIIELIGRILGTRASPHAGIAGERPLPFSSAASDADAA